jgi:hypothetical protein
LTIYRSRTENTVIEIIGKMSNEFLMCAPTFVFLDFSSAGTALLDGDEVMVSVDVLVSVATAERYDMMAASKGLTGFNVVGITIMLAKAEVEVEAERDTVVERICSRRSSADAAKTGSSPMIP